VTTWPAAVQRVADALRDARVEGRVEEFSTPTPTAEAAAEAAGCELAQIVKSLVFECDGRPILAMVPGDRRADPARIASACGAARARVAGPAQVARATGFEAGGVAPFPLARIDTVLIDKSLLTHEVVWVGAGSRRHMAALAPADLVRLTRARPVDAVADNP
jgi:Cys-tRNA(Pro) deacylase